MAAAKKVEKDFDAVFAGLRAVMAKFSRGLVVKADSKDGYWLDTKTLYKGKPVMFGAVRKGKAYVSYHLFPLYTCPELKKGISPALAKRMQGKSCFNFAEVDASLFAELAKLTKRGHEIFQRGVPLP